MAKPSVINRPLTPAVAEVWRAIRLEALRNAPEAFGESSRMVLMLDGAKTS